MGSIEWAALRYKAKVDGRCLICDLVGERESLGGGDGNVQNGTRSSVVRNYGEVMAEARPLEMKMVVLALPP